jgi:hypothetical protein
VVAFGLGAGHDPLELVDDFADGIDRVVPLLEVCEEVVVELHVDIGEVIGALLGRLELLELLVGGLDGADAAVGEDGAFLCLLVLFFFISNANLQLFRRHPTLRNGLAQALYNFASVKR